MSTFASEMKKYLTTVLLLLCASLIYPQIERYAPAWFGPNAFPVPELSEATIVSTTTFDITADYYFGFGDKTKNGYFRVEIPLYKEKVALKIWSAFGEHFDLTQETANQRNIPIEREIKGNANSDIYVQTKIRLNKESRFYPSVILNSTLKTSSGTKNLSKRYYNTSGYYFDVEAGKSFYIKSAVANELRWVATLGFLCWETDNYTQNDAPMYGTKLIISNNKIDWENGIRGYTGWMSSHPAYGADYGDKPVVGFTKLTFKGEKNKYYIQYQYGMRDFPYHQLRAGIQFTSKKLTPVYKND